MNNPGNDNLHLSDDPEENMRIENQLLQLKLKAELGADTFISGNFSPNFENEFLKNVLAFENSLSNADIIFMSYWESPSINRKLS